MTGNTQSSLPDDLLLNAADEVAIRQDLVLIALGEHPAARITRVGRLLYIGSRTWSTMPRSSIAVGASVMSGRPVHMRARRANASTA